MNSFSDSLNMVQNYMDYSNDACMNLFTQGQVNLMRKAFDVKGSRVSILSSKGCQAPAQNEVYFALTFDEFPEDVSWELRNNSNSIIASDGNFEPGNETTNEPSPLANQSLTYTWDLPDGDYTLTLFDSFDDGFPGGSYQIKSIYNEVIIVGPGTFESTLTIPFNVSNTKYKFTGNFSQDWYNPRNWNKMVIPNDCFDDDIVIEAHCTVDKLTLDQQRNLTIKAGYVLTIEE
ncbi:hypothetical protein [Portibacter lacus]|uniref:PKD domain-containing protein n=1 Tax=Portibacter lacus TaxID=1099794 RepID=A0AA37STG7_9BACT|nr:hypothetical protein [Portibacter lacus]GLR19897.1 hypothetical protein GCM10007940_45130 [Portibacter lacus]